MTTNQIAAARQLEEKRHNLVSELYNAGNLSELSRHNLAVESNATGQLRETTRHNVANEGVSARQLEEERRHNIAGEVLTMGSQNEARRHNTATEGETERHNVASEGVSQGNLDAIVQHYNNQDSVAQLNADVQRDLADWRKVYEQAKLEIDQGQLSNTTANTILNAYFKMRETATNLLRTLTGAAAAFGN